MTPSGPVRRVVDLSQPIDETLPVYPGDPVPSMRAVASLDREGYTLLHVSIGSQTGTHVDAPYHLFADGARVDELELAPLVAPATIADLRGRPPRSQIDWVDLAPYAETLTPGRILVLHTGWSQRSHSSDYFDHPFLAVDAARRLVAAGVRVVGVDAASVDETVVDGAAPAGFPVHRSSPRRRWCDRGEPCEPRRGRLPGPGGQPAADPARGRRRRAGARGCPAARRVAGRGRPADRGATPGARRCGFDQVLRCSGPQ